MAIKRTQRDYFNDIIAMATEAGRDDLVEFAEGRIAMLDKKSANHKPSKTAEANEALKVVILDALKAVGEAVTVSELVAKTPDLAGYSNQKLSAILRLMIADGSVVKTVDKKKSLFAVA